MRWPTPNVPNGGRSVKHAERIGRSYYHNGKKVQLGLEAAVRMWPTPRATQEAQGRGDLLGAVRGWQSASKHHGGRTWPTPNCGDARQSRNVARRAERRISKPNLQVTLPEVVGGQLNPDWVEWLMGWPIGWTASEPLAMARFREWWRQHGGS